MTSKPYSANPQGPHKDKIRQFKWQYVINCKAFSRDASFWVKFQGECYVAAGSDLCRYSRSFSFLYAAYSCQLQATHPFSWRFSLNTSGMRFCSHALEEDTHFP